MAAVLRPGDLVVAAVKNIAERAATGEVAVGKLRPAILVELPDAEREWCRPAGLTTLPAHADGRPRQRVYLSPWGLTSPAYLWGGRLVALPAFDIVAVLGRVPRSLARKAVAAMGDPDWSGASRDLFVSSCPAERIVFDERVILDRSRRERVDSLFADQQPAACCR